jgi:hypothetical protein
MSLGQVLNQLVQVLPQLLMVQYILKLVINDLMHIMIEPVRAEPVTDDKVVESVRRYNIEYGGPASWADVVFDFSPEPIRRMVDRWWNSEEGVRVQRNVKERLEALVTQGRLKKVEGGYVHTTST